MKRVYLLYSREKKCSMFKNYVSLFLLLCVCFICGCDTELFNSCKETEKNFHKVYVVNYQTGETSSFDFGGSEFNNINFVSTAQLIKLPDNKILAQGYAGNFIIDLSHSSVTKNPVEYLGHEEADHFYTTDNNHGAITLSSGLSVAHTITGANVYEKGLLNEASSQIFSIKTKEIAPDKFIVPNIFFPVQSFIDGKEGIIAVLDLDTRIVNTDSLNSTVFNNRFYFERKIVLFGHEGKVLEELGEQKNADPFKTIRMPYIASQAEMIAYQDEDQATVIDTKTGKEWTYEGYRAPIISNNGKYIAAYDAQHRLVVINLSNNKKKIIYDNQTHFNTRNSTFSVTSDAIFFREINDSSANIKMMSFEDVEKERPKEVFNLFD